MTSPSNHTPASAAWEPPGSAPRRPNRTRRDRRDDRPRHNERRSHARDLGPDARHLDPREGRRSYDPRTFDLLPASSHGADPYDERAINRRTHRGYSRRSDFEPRTEHGLPRREERQADRRSRRRDLGPDARHLGPTSSFNRRTATDNTPAGVAPQWVAPVRGGVGVSARCWVLREQARPSIPPWGWGAGGVFSGGFPWFFRLVVPAAVFPSRGGWWCGRGGGGVVGGCL